MAESSLVKKLRIRAGQRALILNAPSGYAEGLGDLAKGVDVAHQAEGKYDFVQLFVKDSAEFHALSSPALQAVEYDGLFWLCYPKKSSKVKTDLSREAAWELMDGTGLRPVTQISIDEVWSALRFRPVEQVGR